jgi:hypothetical protein
MTVRDDNTAEILQSVWEVDHDHAHLDEDCSPTKSCRNMKGITFEGFGDPDVDTADAWRARLEREGKLSEEGGTLRDLVFGSGE